jgi:hypothetical protein
MVAELAKLQVRVAGGPPVVEVAEALETAVLKASHMIVEHIVVTQIHLVLAVSKLVLPAEHQQQVAQAQVAEAHQAALALVQVLVQVVGIAALALVQVVGLPVQVLAQAAE